MPKTPPLETLGLSVSNGVAPDGVSTRNNTTRPFRGGGGGDGGPRAGDCGTTRNTQLMLPLTPGREPQRERCRRLLSGAAGRFVKPASELMFDYDEATLVAEESDQEQSVGTTLR